MVGFTGRVSATARQQTPFSKTLESLQHTERLESHVTHETDTHSLGYTAYPEYPIETIETDDLWVYFEGMLYDDRAQALEDELLSRAELMLADEPDVERLSEWLLDIDGEFLLVARDKHTGRLALLNDPLARLPTFYADDDEQFIVSRELRYLLNETEVEFDRLGVAQCLLFGYSLGERTIVENASRLRPGTLLTIDPEPLEISKTDVHTFDFDEHRHEGRTRERNAAELVSRFTTACRTRSGHYDHDVVSLSGGLDSRSVLAAYTAADLSPVAATMKSEEYVPDSDVEVAGQLAADFDTEWKTYSIGRPRATDLDTLVKAKTGQIGLLTSFILEFFRQLDDEYGPSMAYITGDGGDKVLPDLTPSKSLEDGELVDYIVSENSILDIDEVATITGHSEREIRRSISEHVERYPESTPDGRYVHFLLYERAANFLFEGEDRNRQYFWSVTPFYSLPFFQYAMNCPTEQKERYKLYRSFLKQLAPSAAGRVHPIYGAPVNSQRHALAALVDDVLSRYPIVFETVKPIIKSFNDLDTGSTIRPDTIDCMRDQVDRNDAVDQLFDRRELHRFLDESDEHEKITVYRVFALTSVVDDIYSSQSVLEANPDYTFA